MNLRRFLERQPLRRRLLLLVLLFIGTAVVAYKLMFSVPLLVSNVDFPPESAIKSKFAIFGIWDMESGRPHGLLRFHETLRRSGSTGMLFVFCPQKQKHELERYMEGAANFAAVGYDMGVSGQSGLYTFSSLRFTLTDLFLKRYGRFFTLVMTSDLSDVVFTADPFVAIPRSVGNRDRFIAGALETSTINAGGINGYWIQQCFGVATMRQFEGLPVSCSGTTLGDVISMQEYVSAMDRVMRSSPFCSAQGTDQGVHNVVMRQEFSHVVEWMSLESGSVLTLDKVSTIHFDNRGRPVNAKGLPYAVIHQINRCAQFGKFFLEVPNDNSETTNSTRFACRTLTAPPATWWD